MVLSALNDKFIFTFPLNFIPKTIIEKYSTYIKRLPSVFEKVEDLINFSIQKISFVSLSFDPVIQARNQYSDNRSYKASIPITSLYQRELTVTLQLVEGYINYFILYDTFNYWYEFREDSQMHLPDFMITFTDNQNLVISRAFLREPLFKSLSELTLSYNENTQEFKTFDCSFSFNILENKIITD